VQGATLVLENKTGRILAMAGGFSYIASPLNRTSQTQRQPGSAIKPVTYLAALQSGLQPNTLIPDEPITLPPIGKSSHTRVEDYWTPRNADYTSGGDYTLRRGLEYSRNLVTAHLLNGGIDADPEKSLDIVCATAVAAGIYNDCVGFYPFVLGAQPVRMIDLAAFYAAIANDGARPQPHSIDSIDEYGQIIYEFPKTPPSISDAADPASFYQLKTILQGVVERGTARAISSLSPYVAGKTGTTEDAVDGWFVGFTNDVTIAVWVGYDNGDGKRRSLGSSETGAHVALPIFEPILQAVWTNGIAPKTPLNGPLPEARRDLVDLSIDYSSGDRIKGGQHFVEHFRRGSDGQIDDTQHKIASSDSSNTSEHVTRRHTKKHRDQAAVAQDQRTEGGWWGAPQGSTQPQSGTFQPWNDDWHQRDRRRDSDYSWGGRLD
jgi:penicillin-binding protein 1A